MKIHLHILALIVVIFDSAGIQGQNANYLDINNIKVTFNPSGTLVSLEAPKNSGKKTISFSNLWIGGIDAGDYLKIAAQTYAQKGTDFWSGPLDTTTVSTDSSMVKIYDQLWKVNRSTIDSFRSGTGPMTSGILNWPGNGISSHNQAKFLAPFFDKDGNEIYDPTNGDYPKIKGDQALFWVYNDAKNHDETQSVALGLEIHAMAYAFNCSDSAFKNTVFVHYDIINRATILYNNTRIGVWADLDIGNPADDYIGSDSVLNTYFAYNGSANDVIYGPKPPAQGIVFLNTAMSNFTSYHNDFTTTGNPVRAWNYYNYLNSRWIDSTVVTYGSSGYAGVQAANYMFPTDPSSSTGWNEIIAGLSPVDIRGVAATSLFTFHPGEVKSFDIAYVFAQDYSASGTNLSAVNVLKQRIQTVQTAFNNNITPCGGVFNSVNDFFTPKIDFSIYPNPATTSISIQTSNTNPVQISLLNLLGQTVYSSSPTISSTYSIDVSDLPKAMYVVEVRNVVTGEVGRQKVVVE